ncbi:hypothetical protein BH20ACT8_BH20ACT8_19970 [soil metagenome]|jgi:ring-1,2-phenylacetyl-CoA epoxidase subunit PaaB
MRWEVLGRRTHDDAWTAVGAVHAPDRDLALLLAKESFFRHGEGVDLAVVRLADIHRFAEPELLEPSTDKSYRLQRGYPLGDKRRRAAERVQAAGATIDRPRPADRRARNTEHRSREAPSS